jgi:hypothetical protein
MVSLGASVASAYDPWAVQSRIGLADARLALASVLMPRPNLTYIDYRSGVMASGDTLGVGGSSHMAMRVKPAAAGIVVTVEMGNCVINTPSQGAYMCALDSQKTLTLTPASSTTNRIDLIIARVYDDLNSAVASESGVRKFVVEVWQGDAVTGTPTVPVPTPSAGWTPLAAVTVAKNASILTTAAIVDLRGPGLVTRGGMRALYGNDARVGQPAHVEPGAYPGDQRWCHSPGFQHQVYYGAGPDPEATGWHGVSNCVRYYAAAPHLPFTRVTGFGAEKEICSVDIPFPGAPYFVYPTGRAALTMSKNCAADLRINAGTIHGVDINWTRFDTYGATSDKVCVPSVAPMHYGPFIASTTVVLSVAMRDNGGSGDGVGFTGNDTGHNVVSVLVYPTTAQPPAL